MVVIEQVRMDIKLVKHIKVSLGLCEEPLTVTTYHNITLNQYIEYMQVLLPKIEARLLSVN
jgi:hypothetical protein